MISLNKKVEDTVLDKVEDTILDNKILYYSLKNIKYYKSLYNLIFLYINELKDIHRKLDGGFIGTTNIKLQDGLFYCSKKYKTIYKYWESYNDIKDLTIYERIKYQEKKHFQSILSLFTCLKENGIYVCHNFGFDQVTIKTIYLMLYYSMSYFD